MIVLMEVDEDWVFSGDESSTGACWHGSGRVTAYLTSPLLTQPLTFRITTSEDDMRLDAANLGWNSAGRDICPSR